MSCKQVARQQNRTRPKAGRRWLLRAMALSLGLGLSIPALELTLRLLRDPDRFYPYHRNAVRIFYPSQDTTPGIDGVSYFTTNSLGTRGAEPDDSQFRLLVIGGSTTACTALNDDETWPFLLGRNVNERFRGERKLWVTNSGIDGLNSRHHIMHAMYLVPRIPNLDYVLLYAGLNDVGLWLYTRQFDENYLADPDNWARTVAKSFRVSNYTSPDAPSYKHLELWKSGSIVRSALEAAKLAKQRQAGVYVQDDRFDWLKKAAEKRAERPRMFVHRAKIDTLGSALATYRRNLGTIVRECRKSGVEPILMAQYIKWYGLSEHERRRIWMGAMDEGDAYIREEQMGELLARFNHVMKEVADDERVLFVDLPALLQGQRSLCYDGSHFNEKGARVVADILANALIELGLFELKNAREN